MFGEKAKEYSVKSGKEISVFKTPKYEESKRKAQAIIEQYDSITEGDFWILMREAKNGNTMLYNGLIISHNGCLKLNDTLPEEERFDPTCVELDKEGYGGALVYHYYGKDLYEVGEVTKANCKNDYPYAMAFKRCFDRVVLKKTKLAFAGIYSDSEADEFKEPDPEEQNMADAYPSKEQMLADIAQDYDAENLGKIIEYYGVSSLEELNLTQVITCWNRKHGRQ